MSEQRVITERAELDRVTLAREVSVYFDPSGPGFDTIKRMPAGSTGTIMLVIKNGHSYEVEFSKPFAALATVLETEIA